jgi:hypothetical protein
MRKSAWLISILAAGILFSFFFAHAQEDMTHIDNSVFKKPSRPPAAFAHDAHNEAAGIEECGRCHHVYQDGVQALDESSEDQRCAECHDLKPSGNAPALRKAYHLNCRGCHREMKKGPTMCGECHIKGPVQSRILR